MERVLCQLAILKPQLQPQQLLMLHIFQKNGGLGPLVGIGKSRNIFRFPSLQNTAASAKLHNIFSYTIKSPQQKTIEELSF